MVNGSKNKKDSIGLVIEGTGEKSVFAAGVLDFIMEQGMRFSYVIGSSTGISNVYGYCAGQPGYAREHILQYLFRDSCSKIKTGNKTGRKKKEITLDMEALLFSDIPFEVVLTNCETGKPEYFSGCKDSEQIKLLEKASYSMPVLSRMVKIEDQCYMDGAIAEAIPVNRAYKRGNRKNVIILSTNRKRTEQKWNALLQFCNG